MTRTTYVQVKRADGTGFDYIERGAGTPRPADAGALWGDENYRDTKGPNGEDLSTRTKHRAWMQQNGMAMACDYTNEWAAAAAQRDDIYRTGGDHKARREQVARAIHEAHNRR